MAQRHYLMLADGSTIEVTDRVESFEGWEFTEKAEEGAFGSGVIWLSDPDMDLDVDGLRAYFVLEDASEATDNVLWGGFVVDPEVSRGEQGTTHYDPLARAWQLQLTDRNGYWNRRVMVGTDCKRPAESDVTRMQWLLTTSEASWLDDATTYLATGSPSNMDKVDYRGQYLNQILDDCAQHTGKNWWVQLQESGSGRKNVGWYGLDGLTDYTSDILLSNDPTDWLDDALLDGTSLTWPIADQTKLRRDTSRVYSGVYLRYANGTKAIYRRRAASVTAYGYRDYVTDYPNVKTKAKAIARATRLLNDLANPDERITTTVRLPRGKATMLRAGMRVQFRATHLEGYSSWNWLRVLSVSIKPIGIGDQYDLALELQGPGTFAAYSAACALIGAGLTAAGTYGGNGSATTASPGNLFYWKPGVATPTVPTIGFVGEWNFPDYPNDAAGDNASNGARVVVAGSGTLTITVGDYSGSAHHFNAVLGYKVGVSELTHSTYTGLTAGSHTFTIPYDSHCYHWVDIYDDGSVGGGKWQFVSWEWTPG